MRRGMDIITFIQSALYVGDADHDEQVLPDVRRVQLEGIADGASGADLGARNLAILSAENTLAFERIEILGEGSAKRSEVVTFDY